jgi:protein associated with RNAse G/E
MSRTNNAPRTITINSRKYDGSIRRSWSAELTRIDGALIELLGEFEFSVDHTDLGHIEKGTISVESYWLDRWYNVFCFKKPDGSDRNHYINLALPPTFDGDTLDYVDLDIDVIIWPRGEVEVLDIEDFRSNSALYGYPADLIIRVEKTLDEILHAANSSDLTRLYSQNVAAD